MQVINAANHDKIESKSFQHNFLLGIGLSVIGLVIFLLPLTGLLPQEAVRSGIGFWGPVLVGIVLVGGGVWYGWLAWLYFDEQTIQGRVVQILGRILDDDYKYLRNLTLLGNRSMGDIGGVLLGSHGAWVLQICRYRGSYACEGDTWYKYTGRHKLDSNSQAEKLGNKRLDDSPNWQVIRAAREVKAWLSVRDLPQVTVQPIVVLARGRIRYSKRPSCPIVELWYLETYIKNTLVATVPEQPEIGVSGAVVKQIVERLSS